MLATNILLVLINVLISVTQPNFTLVKEFDVRADFITTDQFGNFYSIKSSELSKMDLEKNKKTSFSSRLRGNITHVDSSDPFRILVFFKDFNKIVFLNKALSEIMSPISLDDLGFFNVASVCQSINGGFWIFDQSLNQLVYINKELEITKKSSQLSELSDQNHELSKVLMLEKNDYIYLGINGKSVLLFDNYGTYIKTFPLAYDTIFQVNNGIVSYKKNDTLCYYNSSSYIEDCIALPKQNCKQVLIENKKMFILTEQKVFMYNF